MARALWNGLVFHYLGADEERMRSSASRRCGSPGAGSATRIAALVADTLTDVIDPIVYDEALELIREHRAAGRRVFLVSASPEEIVTPLGRVPRRRRVDRQPGPARRPRPLHRRGRVLRLRPVQGRGGPRRSPRSSTSIWPRATPTATRSPTCRCCEPVGHPVAVNPDRDLARVAKLEGVAGPALPPRGAAARAGRAARRRAGWPWARPSPAVWPPGSSSGGGS